MTVLGLSKLTIRRWAVVAVSALLVVGLAQPASASPISASPTTTAAGASYSAAVTLNESPRTAIAWGSDSVRISVAVSRALYETAPGVLLVSTAPTAKRIADAPALPVLLAPRSKKQRMLVAKEIARLGADWVLPMDAAARSVAKRLTAAGAARVARQADQIPDAASRSKAASMALLVSTSRKKSTRAGLAVARLTGQRLGATVIDLGGNDPRASGAVVKRLAAAAPGTVIGVGAKLGPASKFARRVATAMTGVQLPGGGQLMFPGRTLVALYGKPGVQTMGLLGQQSAKASVKRTMKFATKYRRQVAGPVVPTFEIIATMATADPGSDGTYSLPTSMPVLESWVKTATRAGMYVVLDLQPGRANFLDQAKRLEGLLLSPNVGLALDGEWRVGPKQVPGRVIGSVSATEVNSVIAWLDKLVVHNKLPQKVLVLHQFHSGTLKNAKQIQTNRDGVSVLIHMDGFGSPGEKKATWAAVVAGAPRSAVFGWKNFTNPRNDDPMFTPKQTMKIAPRPVMVSYQ